MVRLSKKNPNNNNDLPTGWTNKDELVTVLLSDKSFTLSVQKGAKVPLRTIHDIKKLMFMHRSWQMTKWGCSILQRSYNWYNIELADKDQITGKVVINLNKIICGPWHIHHNVLMVWNHSSFFELAMFDNDIKRYVDFYVPPIQN